MGVDVAVFVLCEGGLGRGAAQAEQTGDSGQARAAGS
jgi:hypothetical protein